MLDTEKKTQFSQILRHLADSIDISETRYEDAVKKYEAVGNWLGKEGSPLTLYSPEISPQGSFNLGTVVSQYPRKTHMISILSVSWISPKTRLRSNNSKRWSATG